MNEKIEKIIVKFLTNGANEEELEKLADWLKIKNNTHFFDYYIKTNYALDMNMNKFDSKGVKKALTKKIKQDTSIFYKFKIRKVMKYAAVAVIFLGIGYFFQQDIFNTPVDTIPIVVNNNTEAGTNKATLTLEDGSVLKLEKGNAYQSQNANSDGEQIVYKSGDHSSKEIAYNYLTIPRGGKFFIILSDGTQVWLNSESQLKYPISFKDGETRQVELVYGEAYFDVSPSTEHKGSKFKVLNNAQEIKVLGTEFNVKAYRDESNIYTTLVEGKVEIITSTIKQVLIPNQQLNVDVVNKNISVTTVDVKAEIAWIHGDFVFRHKPLKDIIKVLSRWYDVDIEIQNEALENARFNGELSKYQNLEEILSLIKNTNYINQYEINNKKIILK